MEASFTESWAGEHEGDPCLGWQAERVLASLTQNALKWPQENPQQASAKTPTRGAGRHSRKPAQEASKPRARDRRAPEG